MDASDIKTAISFIEWALADLKDALNINDPDRDKRTGRAIQTLDLAAFTLGYELRAIPDDKETS